MNLREELKKQFPRFSKLRIDMLVYIFEQFGNEIIGEDEEQVKAIDFGLTQRDAYLTAKDRVNTENNAKAEQRSRLKEICK